MTLPVTLIAGASGVGKSSVAASLLRRSSHAEAASANEGGDTVWHIDTKYYEARTVVREVGVSSSGGAAQAEAVVLVCSCDAQPSYAAVRAWAETAGALSVEMKLLLANKADLLHGAHDGERRRPAWLDDAMEWCATNNVEYIEVCASDASFDAALDHDGDQQGIARMEQALYTHMWPSMVMKPRAGQGSAAPVPPDGASMQRQGGDGVPRAASEQSAGPTPAAAEAARADVDLSAQLLERLAEQHGVVCDVDGTPAVVPPEHQHNEEIDDLDDFEKVLAHVQDAKQHLAALPDDERRAGAAMMAMRLADMLGLDDDSTASGASSSDDADD